MESKRFVQLSSPHQGVALSFSDPVLSLLQSVLKGALGSQQNRGCFFSRRQAPPPADTRALSFPFPFATLLWKFPFIGAISSAVF